MPNFHFLSRIGALTLCALFIGCAAEKPKIGEPSDKPIETSGDKEGWVTKDKDYWVEKDDFVFRVMLRDEADYQLALVGLDGESYNTMIRMIKIRARVEYDDATKGTPHSPETVGKVRQRTVNAMGEATFSGLKRRNSYWEKWQRYEGGNRYSYFYNVWALYQIPEDEYQRAKIEAWRSVEGGLTEADKDAEQLMLESKDRFFRRE